MTFDAWHHQAHIIFATCVTLPWAQHRVEKAIRRKYGEGRADLFNMSVATTWFAYSLMGTGFWWNALANLAAVSIGVQLGRIGLRWQARKNPEALT